MHYLGILVVLIAVTFATGGHSQTFSKAAEAVTKGDVVEAVDLFSTALRRTIQDADVARKNDAAVAVAQSDLRMPRLPQLTR